MIGLVSERHNRRFTPIKSLGFNAVVSFDLDLKDMGRIDLPMQNQQRAISPISFLRRVKPDKMVDSKDMEQEREEDERHTWEERDNRERVKWELGG